MLTKGVELLCILCLWVDAEVVESNDTVDQDAFVLKEFDRWQASQGEFLLCMVIAHAHVS